MTREEQLQDRAEQLAAISKEASKITEQAKALAKARREQGRAYKQRDLLKYTKLCNDYAEQCRQTRQPMTHAGFMLACGISETSWAKMNRGEYDHLLYAMMQDYNIPLEAIDACDVYELQTEDGEILELPLFTYKQMVEKCRLLIQEQLEQNCYTNKGNPAGSIFGLKARYEWQDTPQTVGTVNNTLVIADKEQAIKALDMLK